MKISVHFEDFQQDEIQFIPVLPGEGGGGWILDLNIQLTLKKYFNKMENLYFSQRRIYFSFGIFTK